MRLGRGLGECDNFKSDPKLVEWTHSDAKWLWLPSLEVEPLCVGAISNAFRRNKQAIHFDIENEAIFKVVLESISATSIDYWESLPQAAIEQNHSLLSINDRTTPKIQTILDRNRSELDNTQRTAISIKGMLINGRSLFPSESPRISIMFYGPPSGSLTLRLIHSCRQPGKTLKIEELHSFNHPIPESSALVTEDLPLHPHTQQHPSELSFTPGIRNTLTIIPPISPHYFIRDVQLLDEKREPYDPHRSISATIDIESS